MPEVRQQPADWCELSSVRCAMNVIDLHRGELLKDAFAHKKAADAATSDAQRYSSRATASFARRSQYAALAAGYGRIAKIEKAMAALLAVAVKLAK